MILIDTNVISEPLRKAPAPGVVAWLDAQPLEILHLSAVTVAELRFGVAAMPDGKRRDFLDTQLEQRILPLFFGRIAAFDLNATRYYAALAAALRSRGLSIGMADAYIAAIALANSFTIATRDTGPFLAAGLTVIDPWNDAHS